MAVIRLIYESSELESVHQAMDPGERGYVVLPIRGRIASVVAR